MSVARSADWISLEVDGGEMAVYVARPEGKARAPGLLVLQEAFGVNSHIQDVARRFAAEGYLVAAPELFHRTAPRGWTSGYGDMQAIMPQLNALTLTTLAADLRATHDWLQSDSRCDSDRVGAIGYCMGGRAAFIANGTLPLKAAVSYYGGRIAPDNLDLAATQSGPILLFWGGKDKHIGREQQNSVAAALRQAGRPFVDVEFGYADHGFFCDERQAYDPAAAKQSWELTRAFFGEHLRA